MAYCTATVRKVKRLFFYITKKSHVLDQENVAKAVTKYERPKMKMSKDLTTLGLPEDYCASKGVSSWQLPDDSFMKMYKALTKYERPKMKSDAQLFLRKRLHFCRASLFFFGRLYFFRALAVIDPEVYVYFNLILGKNHWDLSVDCEWKIWNFFVKLKGFDKNSNVISCFFGPIVL